MRLEGATALITGASTGIGAATARDLAGRGAHVLALARTESKLAALCEEIRGAGGRADHYPVDVSDAAAVGTMAERVLADHGAPDVVVNNAGAGRWLFVEETQPDEFLAQAQVPYLAAFYVTRAFVEPMMARGSGQVAIVNTPASRYAWPGALGYTAARWALRGFAEALRADLAGTGVGVTEVVPGKVTSDYFENNPGAEERIPRIARFFPTLTPEETAKVMARAIERERRVVHTPAVYSLLAAQTALMPRLTSWLVVRTGAKRSGG